MTSESRKNEAVCCAGPATQGSPCREMLSSRQLNYALLILLAYFGLRLIFFAASISPYVPPDEVTHFGVSRLFSRVLLLPADSPDSYPFGLITHIPWLYYWIMGKLLALNWFGISDLTYLRLCNLPLAFGTVYFSWRLLRLVTEDRLTQLLLVLVLTNTLMFSFLSASVSYDNLTNLLAVMSLYYLMLFCRERSVTAFSLTLLSLLAGCLTKVTFLPLALIEGVLLLYALCRGSFSADLRHSLAHSGKLGRVAILALLVGFLLNLQLYGGNLYRYHRLAPEMSQVLSPGIALKNRIAARDMIFTWFKEGKLSRDQALAQAARIDHVGDREDTIALIKEYEELQKRQASLETPWSYIDLWIYNMLSSVFGIKCHLGMLIGFPTLWVFVALLAFAGVAVVVGLCRSGGRIAAYLALIAGCYALILMYGVNYRTYLFYGNVGLALQGRYIFPVLAPIYALSCCYSLRLFRQGQRRLWAALALGLLFVCFDFPYFLSHAGAEWFAGGR